MRHVLGQRVRVGRTLHDDSVSVGTSDVDEICRIRIVAGETADELDALLGERRAFAFRGEHRIDVDDVRRRLQRRQDRAGIVRDDAEPAPERRTVAPPTSPRMTETRTEPIAGPPTMPAGMRKAEKENVYLWTAPGGLEIQMVYVPSGDFVMGSDDDRANEKPKRVWPRMLARRASAR